MDPQRGAKVIYQINFMGRNWDINGPTKGWWSYLSNKFYGSKLGYQWTHKGVLELSIK